MKDSNTMLKKVIMNDNRNLNFLIDLNITFKLALLCSFLLYSKYHVLIHAMCSLSLQAYQLLWRCLFQYHQSPPELDKPVLPGETAHYCLSICLFYVVMVLPVTHVPLSIRPHPPAAGLAPVASTIYNTVCRSVQETRPERASHQVRQPFLSTHSLTHSLIHSLTRPLIHLIT